ncbi:MAG: hypothetical protein FJ291_07455 [Planctomycetes bacterium]|nr:hypothetical protein [Planctomycetota bacterium]
MRELVSIVLASGVLVLAGCGGGDGKPKAADTAPFEAALVEYLRVSSMDMKPEKFESLEVEGDSATAKVRMATKDDLYGVKPLWTVTFERGEKGWRVLGYKP